MKILGLGLELPPPPLLVTALLVADTYPGKGGPDFLSETSDDYWESIFVLQY